VTLFKQQKALKGSVFASLVLSPNMPLSSIAKIAFKLESSDAARFEDLIPQK
jgi:hypothetical protein